MTAGDLPPWFQPDLWVPPPGSIEGRRVSQFMVRHGLADYASLLRRSAAEPEWFYPAAFDDLGLEWPRAYDAVCDEHEGPALARWFVGGQTNLAYMAVDRWTVGESASRQALIWEAEDGTTSSLTFAELGAAVERCAAGLRTVGVDRGDVIALYLPMIPEAAIALLAAARIGAIVAPAFSGYGHAALGERLRIASAKVLIAADGFLRRGKEVNLRASVEAAVSAAPSVATVIVVPRLGVRLPNFDRCVLWETVMGAGVDRPLTMYAGDTPWLLAFTSGSAGRPKGAVHTHGGLPYRVPIELAYNFDLYEGDRLTWITDMGWVMGPLALVGTLTLGGCFTLLESTPDYPRPDRLWALVERHSITHLGLSPTVVRVLASNGTEWVERHALETLRVLGATGEPWTPAAWRWLHRYVARGRAPIINWSGGTEIGAGVLVGSPVVPTRECRFSGPAPGMSAQVYDAEGRPVVNEVGELVITRSWPSMTKGLWGEPERFLNTYWSRWPGVWVHGDRAIQYRDGSWEILGRSDDVMKIAGKRVGPVEVESAATEIDGVRDALAIGMPNALKGEALVLLVVPSTPSARTEQERLERQVSDAIAAALGNALRPAAVLVVEELPMSGSGKVQRRIARAWLSGRDADDLSVLANPDAAAAILAAGQRLREDPDPSGNA
jgi:acetyl-CoA synthetase